MSITTATNLSVGNSLTVVGNTILGADSTSTLIVNSPQTLNNGCTMNGAVTHASGTFNTSSGNFYMNGNVLINNNATFTTSTGKTTINSILSEIYGNVSIMNTKTLNFTNTNYTAYLIIDHDGTDANFRCTGAIYFYKNGTTKSFAINSDGTAIFYYKLTLNAALDLNDNLYIAAGKSLYVSDSAITPTKYIRVSHDGNQSAIIDYTGKLYIRNDPNNVWVMRINSDYQANFYYNLNTVGITNSSVNPIINNGTLSQVGTSIYFYWNINKLRIDSSKL